MAIKFQYNKTFLQQLGKGLKVRENALPTLVAKESALRVEVKKARESVASVEQQLTEAHAAQKGTSRFWSELPANLVTVKRVQVDVKKIAGVKTPVLQEVFFTVERYSAVLQPAWLPEGIESLKKVARLMIEAELAKKKVEILEYARKKTTQKVNLYEKVQIPEYREAIRKIKRFMEDEDNLSKSSQKILKAKIAAEAA
jgi:V/A-type H+/Na+-transporting ATPase subunit D